MGNCLQIFKVALGRPKIILGTKIGGHRYVAQKFTLLGDG